MAELPDVMTYDAPTTPAGLRLLDTAARLFYEHGIRGVGVELIAQDAGTTKKTLYDRFGSKDALVTVYLRRRGAQWQEHVLACLTDRPDPGPDRLLAVFDAAAAWLDRQKRGCAFVNAFAEIGDRTDHPALPVVRAEKAWMRGLFTTLADEASYDDPGTIGAQLHLLYEGAVVAVTAGAEADGLTHARSAAARLLAVG